MSRFEFRSRPRFVQFWAVAVLAAAIVALGPAKSRAGDPEGLQNANTDATFGDNPWTLCARYAAEIERRDDLPPHLLSAISKVESGRWRAEEGSVHAWPWTVTSGSQGHFFDTMDEALEAIHALQASGRRNIDVGCMQINLYHHPDAFENMRAALDPARNIAYAAALLLRLQKEAQSWPKAVAYYHSRSSQFNGPYRRKVFRAWHEEWRLAGLLSPGMTAQGAAPYTAASPGEGAADPIVGTVSTVSFAPSDRQVEPGFGEIQLGAFREPQNARVVWAKLRRENADLLGALDPRIEVTSGGALGTLHQLRAGPAMKEKVARSICRALRDRAVDCLFVTPPSSPSSPSQQLASNVGLHHLH